MGVRGLTTFIDERQRLVLMKAKISDQSLIVDGNALMYFLYHSKNLDIRFGGDYDSFGSEVEKLFQNFAKCCIKPIIVFDGGCMPEKEATQLARQVNNINIMTHILSQKGISSCGGFQLLPLLTVYSFRQTLNERNVPVVWSISDADCDMAALANYLNAPVLSNDSDFFIFDVAKGYLPLAYFDWQEVHTSSDGCYMHGLLYHTAELLSLYKLNERSLSFLPILLGSDWLSPDICSGLLRRILAGAVQGSKREKKKAKKAGKIEQVLRWLSQYKDDEAISESICTEIAKAVRGDFPSRMRWCLNKYRLLEKPVEILEYLKEKYSLDMERSGRCDGTEQQDAKGNLETSSDGSQSNKWHAVCAAEDNFRHSLCDERTGNLIRRGHLHSFMASVFTNYGKIFLPVVISAAGCPSPHACSSLIRNATYRLLHVYHLTAEDAVIVEYDRRKKKYGKASEIHLRGLQGCPCACHTSDSLQEMMLFSLGDHVVGDVNRGYLLESLLGCKDKFKQRHENVTRMLDNLRSNLGAPALKFELFFIVMSSWRHSDDIKPPRPLLIAFLVILAHAVARESRKDSDQSEPDPPEAFDVVLEVAEHVEELSQWQCLLHASLILNRTLCFPVNDPPLSKLNLSHVAMVYHKVSKWRPAALLDDVRHHLSSSPKWSTVFSLLVDAI